MSKGRLRGDLITVCKCLFGKEKFDNRWFFTGQTQSNGGNLKLCSFGLRNKVQIVNREGDEHLSKGCSGFFITGTFKIKTGCFSDRDTVIQIQPQLLDLKQELIQVSPVASVKQAVRLDDHNNPF